MLTARRVIGCSVAILGVLGVTFNTLVAAEPQPGKQVHASLKLAPSGDTTPPDTELRYQLFLPKGYAQDGPSWPLMLFLHGAGERGTDLDLVKVHGPPKIVDSKPDFPFIVASPQCPLKQRWHAEQLIQLIDALSKDYRVDPKRIYVTGLSMGGFGTWSLCAAYPGRFAAAVPICGGGNVEDAAKLKSLPLWVFHGAKDGVVTPDRSESMVKAVEAAGGKPKFTVYPEAAHDSWTETYNNQALYDWLLEQKLP